LAQARELFANQFEARVPIQDASMPSVIFVSSLVALLVGALAARDEGDELRILAQEGEGADSGSLHSSAAGDLNGKGRAASGSTHICCVTLNEHGRRMDPELTVYHESATSALKQCGMTMITGTKCHDQTSCMEECKRELLTNKQYNLRVQDEMNARDKDTEDEITAFKEEEGHKRNEAIKEAELAYQQEVKQADEAVAEAEEAMNEATKRADELKKQYEELQRELQGASAQVEQTAKHAEESKEAYTQAEKTASETKDRSGAQAASKFDEAVEEADRRAKALEEKTAERKERYAALVDHPVPEACRGDVGRDGEYAAVNCCCSINGIPMMVDKHFADWGRCVNPKKYKRNLANLFTCPLYRECTRCRELVCGTGMCPLKQAQEE